MTKALAILSATGSPAPSRADVWLFLSKPLLAHAVDQATEAPSVGRIIVWTDDAEQATLAEAYGVEVVVRPDLPGETAAAAAARQVLQGPLAVENCAPELVVFVDSRFLLRRDGEIERAIEAFQHQQVDSLFSAYALKSPTWRRSRGELSALSTGGRPQDDTQAAAHDLVENRAIYVFKPWVLREYGGFLGGRIGVHEMDRLDALEVTEIVEFRQFSGLESPRRGPLLPPDLANLRLLVLDFDGVMTDNRVLVSEDGSEAVLCHRGDGWGLARLKEQGVEIAVLSTEVNGVVAARCRKLGLTFVQACDDKLSTLRRWIRERGLVPEQVAYVGNDVNDLDCLRVVGVPIAVADAVPQVREAARFLTSQRGGYGAVREVADWLIAARRMARSALK
jgi:YrbI family 3-deoxy-D-manno-octulosonate 8-phosphate phosphatase